MGPKNKFLTAIIVQYFFAFGQLFLVGFAYFIREWRPLTLTLSLFTIPFTFFYLSVRKKKLLFYSYLYLVYYLNQQDG